MDWRRTFDWSIVCGHDALKWLAGWWLMFWNLLCNTKSPLYLTPKEEFLDNSALNNKTRHFSPLPCHCNMAKDIDFFQLVVPPAALPHFAKHFKLGPEVSNIKNELLRVRVIQYSVFELIGRYFFYVQGRYPAMSPKFLIGSFFFPIGLRRVIHVGAKGCLCSIISIYTRIYRSTSTIHAN